MSDETPELPNPEIWTVYYNDRDETRFIENVVNYELKDRIWFFTSVEGYIHALDVAKQSPITVIPET